MPKHWTENEIVYLKRNYGYESRKETSDHLGRPISGIKAKASQLGLKFFKRRSMKICEIIEEWSENEAAYIAGIIDADGCFYLRTKGKKSRSLHIGMTHKPTMLWLGSKFNVDVHAYNHHGNHKTFYKIFVGAGNILRAVIDKTIPFLITKKEKAKAILDYLDNH